MRVATLSFREGNFEELEVHENLDSARGYALGFRRGAQKYGSGSAFCLVMPEDIEDLQDFRDGAHALEIFENWVHKEELRMLPGRD